jgi:taurine dioxygenase
MGERAIEVRPLASALGAEVLGVDLSTQLDDKIWSQVHEAYLEHHVIFFRDQQLTPEQHLTFSRRFGELEPYPFVHGIEGHPELIELVKMPDEVRGFGGEWHVDMSFREQPPAGAVLHALEVPPAGGDTLFSNLCLAYETLSVGMKALLERIRGVHDSRAPADHSQQYKGMKMQQRKGATREKRPHPMLRTHPDTGQRSLFISPSYCWQLEGMTEEESSPLLDYLEQHATRHEFICRFRWEPNSIAIWDNRCTMHYALQDDLSARAGGQGFKRVMRRSTIRW